MSDSEGKMSRCVNFRGVVIGATNGSEGVSLLSCVSIGIMKRYSICQTLRSIHQDPQYG